MKTLTYVESGFLGDQIDHNAADQGQGAECRDQQEETPVEVLDDARGQVEQSQRRDFGPPIGPAETVMILRYGKYHRCQHADGPCERLRNCDRTADLHGGGSSALQLRTPPEQIRSLGDIPRRTLSCLLKSIGYQNQIAATGAVLHVLTQFRKATGRPMTVLQDLPEFLFVGARPEGHVELRSSAMCFRRR